MEKQVSRDTVNREKRQEFSSDFERRLLDLLDETDRNVAKYEEEIPTNTARGSSWAAQGWT